jgi:streptogramin lyase
LRGIGLAGGPNTEIPVDAALESNGVAAFVSGAGYLWVGSSVADRIYRVDPRTNIVKQFQLHQSADVLVFADGSLFALDTLDGKITRLDPSNRRSLPSLTVSGNLQGMAVGGGYVWVTDASGNMVERIAEDLLSAPTSVPVGQIGGSPTAVAYDDGAIMVGFKDGTISKINTSDPSSPAVIWSRRVGNDASSVAVDRGIVWVAGGGLSNL